MEGQRAFAERISFLLVTWGEREECAGLDRGTKRYAQLYDRKGFGVPDEQGLSAGVFVPPVAATCWHFFCPK